MIGKGIFLSIGSTFTGGEKMLKDRPSIRPWLRRMLAFVAGLFLLSLLASCGGSGGGGGGGGTTGTSGTSGGNGQGTLLSYTSVNSVVQGGLAQLQSTQSQSQSPADREAGLIDWLKKQPDVAAAGSTNVGTVWARFTDGEYWIVDETLFPQTLPVAPSPSPSPSPDQVSAPVQVATAALVQTEDSNTLELPTTNKAVLLDSVPSLGTPTADLANALHHKGYVVNIVDPTVENLKTAVNQVAVLHWSTHGATVDDSAGNRQLWGAFTTTPSNAQTRDQYAADLAADRLVIYSAPIIQDNEEVYISNLAITDRFITYYHWSFATHGFAFIDCCWSADSMFTTSLRELPDGPAGFTLGWSNAANPEKAWAAAKFFIDRLVGANMLDPKEIPPQRPFWLASVFAEAQDKGFTDASTDRFGTSTLEVEDNPSSGLLAPTIEYGIVQERGLDDPTTGKNMLVLKGSFGNVQGHVYVDTTELTGCNWSSNEIRCDLPEANAPGGSGDILVVSKTGILSNQVPLTLWHFPVTYAESIGGVQNWKDVDDIYLRADVHSYREQAGGDLKSQPTIFFRAAQPSSAHWTYSGIPTLAPSSGDLPYGFRTSGIFGLGFIFEGDIEPDAKTINIGWTEFGVYGIFHAPPAPDTTYVMPLDVTYNAQGKGVGPDGFTLYKHPISGTFDTNWVLQQGDVTGAATSVFGDHLTWDNVKPTHAPDPSKGEDDGAP